MHKADKRIATFFLTLMLLVGVLPCQTLAASGNISDGDKYAWSESGGWIDFKPADGGVTVHETWLAGYAWAENIGWIKLGTDAGGPYANDGSATWGVNRDASGNLSGYAWSETAGWINFNPTHSQVTIDPTTGSFDGYAWSENLGWIHFKNLGPAYNVLLDENKLSIASSVEAGGTHTGQIKSAGSLWTWGNNSSSQLGYDTGYNSLSLNQLQVGSDLDWAQASFGNKHSVALKTDGSLWAWGDNGKGQLGDGTYNSVSLPTQIGDGYDWTAVSAGWEHTLALKSDGSLWAWGYNLKGQLGLGDATTRNLPTQVEADSFDPANPWTAVIAGPTYSLALKADGTLWGWGDDWHGQLGQGTSEDYFLLPVQIDSLDAPGVVWTDMAAGYSHVLAIDSSGHLWAWGDGDFGQLGDGASGDANMILTPLEVSTDTYVSVAAGYDFSAALKTGGTLWTWGANDWGQLGNGSGGLGFFESSPGQIGASTDWIDIDCGNAHLVALHADETVETWGSNQNGQLGDGTLNDSISRTLTINPVTTPTNESSLSVGGTVTETGLSAGTTVTVELSHTDAYGSYVSETFASTFDEVSGAWSATVDFSDDAEYTLTITAENAADIYKAQAREYIVYDSTPPQSPGVSSASAATQDRQPLWTWSGDAVDGSGTFRFQLDNSVFDPAEAGSSTTSYQPAVPLDDGGHTLYVQERDEAGNWSASGSFTVLIDNVPPSAPSVDSASGLTNNGQPTWTWSSGGGGNGNFRTNLDGGGWSSDTADMTFTPTAPLSDGSHTLEVQERDAAGNWSSSGSFLVEVDLIPPSLGEITVDSPTNSDSQQISGLMDSDATLDITVDTAATATPVIIQLGQWIYDISGLVAGQNVVTATATDPAGNETVETAVIYLNSAPTVASAIPDQSATEDAPFTFTVPSGTFDDLDGDSLDLSATLSDGSVLPAWLGLSGSSFSGTPANDDVGAISVKVTATDPYGLTASDVFVLTVSNVNDAPVISGQNVLSIPEDTSLTIDFTDLMVTDPDNNYPTGFSLTVQAGANYGVNGATITPAADFNGTLTVPVLVNDGNDDSNTFNLSVEVSAINDAPVISGQNALSIPEDTSMTIAFTDLIVTDPDNSYPSGFSLTVQAGANYGVNGATITPAADFNGTLAVPVLVNDGTDDSNTFNLNVEVSAVNDAPTISGTPAVQAAEDSYYSFTPIASDVDAGDTETLTFSYNTIPAWASFDSNTGQLSGTPNNSHAGTVTSGIVITVTDQAGASASLPAFDIAVQNVNDPPQITSTAPATATEDMEWSYTATVIDPDDSNDGSGALSWSLDNAPAGMAVSSTGQVTWTPSEGVLTSGEVTLRVADGGEDGAAPATEVFTVTVTPVNDAPVITGQSALTTPEDTPLIITLGDLTVTDPDNTYPDDFALTVQPGTNYSVSGTTITPDADFTGILTVPVLVNDGAIDSAAYNLSVEVGAVNDAPVITGQSVLNTPEETDLTITLGDLTVTDPDSAYPTGFALTVQPGTNYSVSGTTITPDADFFGNLTVPVLVNDGIDNSNTFNLSVEVSAVNDAPTISGTPYTTAVPGQGYSFIPFAWDVDAGDSLTFSINLTPGWATFDPSSGKLSGTPAEADADITTSGIEITVTDGSATAKLTAFDLTVRANAAPTVSGDPYTTAVPGQIYSFVPEAADADPEDDGHLSFSIENLPSWASFNASTGELSGTPTATDAGVPNDIKITVTDSAGDSDFLTFTLTVRDNFAPVINGTPDETAIVDDFYSFTPDASDQDNESLSYSIANKPSWATFDLSDGSLTGTPGTDNLGPYPDITITVTDSAGAEAVLKFDLTVEENHPPLISGTPLTTAVVGQEYSFTPVASDQDGDNLTFAITVIPGWAAFDEATGTLTGIPQSGDVGSITEGIMISVKDSYGTEVPLDSFDLTVIEGNNAPTISGTPLTTAVPGKSYAFSPIAEDVDADEVLTFSINKDFDNELIWAQFDSATGTLTGTPGEDDMGTTEGIVITVTDSAGASASLPAFDLTVRANEAPTLTNSLSEEDIFAWVGNAFTLKVPDTTFVDNDLGDTLTLAATLEDGSALPEWLDFMLPDQELWGTPFSDDFGTLKIRLTATDTAGESVSDVFTLHIARVASVQGGAFEWGTFEAEEGSGIRIPFVNDYLNPVVVAQPLAVDTELGLVRLDEVTADTFGLTYDEPYSGTGRSIQVFYLVAESGTHDLGGLTVQAGTVETGAVLPNWQTVSFYSPFSEAPAVFTSVQTANDASAVLTRVQNLTASDFGVAMQDPFSESTHSTESLGWIAIEKGVGMTADGKSVMVFGASATEASSNIDLAEQYADFLGGSGVSEKFYRLFPLLTRAIAKENYDRSFTDNVPVLIGEMNTAHESDPAVLRYRSPAGGDVEVFVKETQSGDGESPHALEDISIFLAE